MRLWLRVALGIASVSVLALLITGAVAVNVAADAATRAAVEAQERDAGALAALVERWMDEQAQVLLGWALAFPVAELDEARRVGLARAVLTGVPSTVTVVLVDGDGVPVAPGAWFADPPADEDWIRGDAQRAERLVRQLPLTAALESARGTAVGDPEPGEPPTVAVAVAASREPPLVLGVELALTVAEALREAAGPDRAVILVDAAGERLAGAGDPGVDLPRLRPFFGTRATFVVEADGQAMRGAVAPAGAGWSVLVLEPEAVALQGAHRIGWRIAPGVLGAMALSVVAGLALGRTVTEPLARLRHSVQALSEGQYGARVEVRSTDEVGELAEAFNAMSARLLDNRTEITRQREAIESFNRELQDRIDAATQDLREAQERLVRSGQLAAVAQIGAGLAHELNNPLMAVLGLAQVLEGRAADPALREVAADLIAEAQRCREVVDALLRLTDSAEPGASAPGGTARVDLRALVAELRATVASAVGRRGVRLDWGEAPSAPVHLEPGAAVRALGALIAALAGGLPEGGLLTVQAAVEGPVAVLRLEPHRAVEGDLEVERGRDTWMAAGLDVWVARQTLERLGAEVAEPEAGEAAWRVRIPAG